MCIVCIALLGAPCFAPSSRSIDRWGPAVRALEIRWYNLKPGTRDEFHQLFLREALPLLRRWEVDVVAFGPSAHDADSYFLMRAFESLDDRQRSEDAFYASNEWRHGPREAVLSRIASCTTIVVEVDEATLEGLRRAARARESGERHE